MTEQATAEASAIQAIFRKPLNKGAFEILNAGREDTTQRAMVVGVYPHKNHSVTVDDIVESVMNDALPIARSIMPALRKAHEVNLSACTQRTQLVELLYQRIYLREIQTRQMVYLMPPARLQRTRGAETPAHELYGRDFHPEQHRAVIGCLRHTFNGERKQAILAWSDLDHGEPSGSLGNFAKENLFVLNLFAGLRHLSTDWFDSYSYLEYAFGTDRRVGIPSKLAPLTIRAYCQWREWCIGEKEGATVPLPIAQAHLYGHEYVHGMLKASACTYITLRALPTVLASVRRLLR